MAYISLADIKASGDMSYDELKEYDTQLQSLIVTVEGTLPGSRGFGLNPDILDKPPDDVLNLFAMDLQEKAEKYIPDVVVVSVDGEMKDESAMSVQIFIERRESSD